MAVVTLTILIAYLIGSIPTGYCVARARGLDIRNLGSGNIGATNVMRILGKPLGMLVLAVDGLKGWTACVYAAAIAQLLLPGQSSFETALLRILAGIAAVLGHNFTCWLRFKGGKGIATSAGVLAALMPKALAVSVLAFAIVLAFSRYVSLASIAAALILPVAAWKFALSPALLALSTALGALAVFRHRANIRRLLAGTEPRIGQPSSPKSQP